jgi:5-methylthioadenosine/S-adenosylhomocysteine deaminase
LAKRHGVLVHTHASENRQECEIVERETGERNIDYLHSLGLTGRHVVLAHCIHLDNAEMETLAASKTNVAHCPSSNLKLGSGIARVTEMLARGIPVSLGADGAPCNNRLDMFTEMRTAALLQKALHGPEVLPAARALQMATIEGARAMGLENEIGSLEAGKRADIIVVDLQRPHSTPVSDVVSALVYSAQPSDVRAAIIDGRLLLNDGELVTMNEAIVVRNANREAGELVKRAQLSSR